MGERWQLTPPGTRDLLPDEASRSREVVDAVLGLLRRWGYREVVTPTLEYLDVLVRGEGTEAADRLFKLIDRGGELLALRPEMTTPVARLVATQLRHEPLPIRLAYAGQVFRGGEPGAGRLREFPQVGCELVGADSPEADAEIVALAVEALRAAGVGQFSLSVGHGGFLRSLLEGLGVSEEEMGHVRAALYRKDFVGLQAVLDRYALPAGGREALLALPSLRGPEALREARDLVGARLRGGRPRDDRPQHHPRLRLLHGHRVRRAYLLPGRPPVGGRAVRSPPGALRRPLSGHGVCAAHRAGPRGGGPGHRPPCARRRGGLRRGRAGGGAALRVGPPVPRARGGGGGAPQAVGRRGSRGPRPRRRSGGLREVRRRPRARRHGRRAAGVSRQPRRGAPVSEPVTVAVPSGRLLEGA